MNAEMLKRIFSDEEAVKRASIQAKELTSKAMAEADEIIRQMNEALESSRPMNSWEKEVADTAFWSEFKKP